jgi:hypothetical protein
MTDVPMRRTLPDRERIRGRFLDEAHPIRSRRARRTLLSLQDSTDTPPRRASSPLIVVGMHRSGTSLTARILHSLGVDMGHDANTAHHESLGFVMRNRLLLSATKAEWDQPQPFLDALDDPHWRRTLALLLAQTIEAPRSWLLGLHEPPTGTTGKDWGWKDPRNSLTWPLWLELYPSARFVRVQRNRSDVVASLVARSRDNLRRQTDLSIRTLTEPGAESLCRDYAAALVPLDTAVEATVEATVDAACEVPVDRIFDIRYETLVSDPATVISALAAWLGGGLDAPGDVDVAAAIALVRTSPPTATGTLGPP